jgi:hypothetical protein
MSAFDLYWRAVGLPLSRFKGLIVDRLPFSLVEVLLWLGAGAVLFWVLSWIKPLRGRIGSRARVASFLLGPVLLLILGSGQGALPFSCDPTAWRAPLAKELGADSLGEEAFKSWAEERDRRLLREFDETAYEALSEEEGLRIGNASLDSVLADLGLPPGRAVKTMKPMGPLTAAIGLIYGGLAFHDGLTEELGLVRPQDGPSPHYWRLISVCHEAAHAKGFSREVDAEILTQLALLRAPDPRFRVLADLHFLGKTGLKLPWPESLVSEYKRIQQEKLAVEKNQRVISLLKRWAAKGHMRNSSQKYGTRTHGQAWNPRQPFFATVHRLEARIEGSRHSTDDPPTPAGSAGMGSVR